MTTTTEKKFTVWQKLNKTQKQQLLKMYSKVYNRPTNRDIIKSFVKNEYTGYTDGKFLIGIAYKL